MPHLLHCHLRFVLLLHCKHRRCWKYCGSHAITHQSSKCTPLVGGMGATTEAMNQPGEDQMWHETTAIYKKFILSARLIGNIELIWRMGALPEFFQLWHMLGVVVLVPGAVRCDGLALVRRWMLFFIQVTAWSFLCWLDESSHHWRDLVVAGLHTIVSSHGWPCGIVVGWLTGSSVGDSLTWWHVHCVTKSRRPCSTNSSVVWWLIRSGPRRWTVGIRLPGSQMWTQTWCSGGRLAPVLRRI
jgi:hypothetical protein